MAAQDAVLVLTPGPAMSVLAGTGRVGDSSAGVSATSAPLAGPSGVVYDPSGNLLFADTRNHRVRSVSPSGVLTTVAGTGVQGFAGDGGPANAAQLDSPMGVAVAADGTLYIADTRNHCVRRVSLDGTISTVAGTGVPGFAGDTGKATAALLRAPAAVALGLLGEVYIADTGNHRVRRVALDGTISTVAGSGREEAIGDGGRAVLAGLDAPSSVAVRASDAALLIADRLNSRIRVVTGDGTITSLNPGTAALRRASGVSIDGSGNVFIADRGNYRLRAVTANGSGVLLGSGEQGLPDPSAAYNGTPLGSPYALVPDHAGGLSFSDRDHSEVQHLALPQLVFATTAAGQTSPSRTIALQNTGAESLAITSITSASSFPIGSDGSCGAAPFSIAPGTACTVSVAFSPKTVGPQSSTLAVIPGGGLPQQALLQGTAVATGTLLQSSTLLQTSGNLSYVGMPVTLRVQVLTGGTATPSGFVHLLDASTEVAQAALDVSGSASFTTSSLTGGQHTLSARYDGDARYATSISAVQTQTVVLAPDFTLTAAASSLSMASGAVAQMAVMLQPINGTLNQAVTLRIDGLPNGATATNDAPIPLVLTSNAVTVTFSVKSSAATAGLDGKSGLVWLALLGVPLLAGRRPRSLFLLLLSCGSMLLLGCSGGYLGGPSTTAQSAAHSYPVTVTATATGVTGSALVHTASFTLVVR